MTPAPTTADDFKKALLSDGPNYESLYAAALRAESLILTPQEKKLNAAFFQAVGQLFRTGELLTVNPPIDVRGVRLCSAISRGIILEVGSRFHTDAREGLALDMWLYQEPWHQSSIAKGLMLGLETLPLTPPTHAIGIVRDLLSWCPKNIRPADRIISDWFMGLKERCDDPQMSSMVTAAQQWAETEPRPLIRGHLQEGLILLERNMSLAATPEYRERAAPANATWHRNR